MKPVLFLPIPLALATGLLTGVWLDTLVFSLLYLGTLRLAEEWGSDGWILLFCGGEPLVLVTAGKSWEAAVLLQVLVLWAAVATTPDRSAPWWGWVLVGAGFVLSGGAMIAALSDLIPALLAVGGLLLSAFSLVWLAEHQMRSRVEIGR
ncbi:hypothetical protein E2N92_00050 [Methanofollis formosanus]|uniref:Uncharacterized protein n=1 Tax=Methanofollis formosanus TaxID=299308 RepID=A0A8G0ZZW6_9EURY|nr:hypothetical protein [Methanofollis formosanus]QYZ77928.1 hypothetical protein E2N92_00050 [Methanofollis formosanus]